jgi:hypothetical protein
VTALDTDQAIHEQVEALRAAAAADVPRDVRDYYDGDHPPVATPDQMAALGDRAMKPYVENVLKQCVDTLAARLLFRRYLCESNPNVQAWLAEFARKNQLGEHVITNTVRVLVDGNNALSLSWNGERALVHQEPWWDGDEGMYVEVGEDTLPQWAVKEWEDLDTRTRRTIYLPDQIQRYVRVGGTWEPFVDAEGNHIVPWVKRDGSPLGVPVVHFGNTITAESLYGASTVAPLLGLQDALNGTIFDIVAAQAMNAFGIYTATGVASGGDYFVGPGRRWESPDKDARFGLLQGSEMGPILDGYRAIRAAIANQFPISEHLITGGDWPSGMALQRAEGPMISKVKLLGETFAPSWVLLAHRATEMAIAFGGETLDDGAMIQVEYEPAEQLDEGTTTEIDIAKVQLYRDLSMLPRSLMLKTGLVDEGEADAIVGEREAATLSVQRFLDAGGLDPLPEGE